MKFSAKEVRKNIMHVVGGTILTEDFFLKNTRFMVVLFVIVMLYIGNRYSCIEKMAKIESLKRELKDEKYESLAISSQLTNMSRRSQVISLVESNGLGLETAQDPIFKIENTENKED
ncbi:cell division protein FtsL [Dysgonomonas sp. PH5-45]|uniref:FtsL-like putative cell division protein n=1 Tax=unclassified Dysgonomonas TaxID=2630389 RepID=UPI0024771E79|nr:MULTISPECIES: FtsL-like putative cell division protein [unclassified Dysgonomonas]MDH6355713.1 cell division protein FtsL [Dysgonomonas sp. PH5-45]MDH6388610.1 cell division protein FtsL [Dysgonomonas sp. PH5-37]